MDTIAISIPKDLENMALPAPELITFYRNLENRVLWLDSEVDDSFTEFARYIIDWNREDMNVPVENRKPIKLMILSYGGDLSINNMLINLIKISKTPVWGINMGHADSAGCFIFMSCHKRLAMPNSTFLIHKGSASFDGTYEEVTSHVLEYQRVVDELCDYIMNHSNISESILNENIWGEWFITAKEAVDYGFVDKIVDDINDIL